MGFSGWNELSIQYAIENHFPINFDNFSRVDLNLFSKILYAEYKKIHLNYLDICHEYDLKPIVKDIDFNNLKS